MARTVWGDPKRFLRSEMDSAPQKLLLGQGGNRWIKEILKVRNKLTDPKKQHMPIF